MKKQPGAVEAGFLFTSHSAPPPKDVGLISARVHLDACQACREAMIDHANRITLKEVATEKGLSIEDVICELGRVAITLQQDANERGVPLTVVVKELLARMNRNL